MTEPATVVRAAGASTGVFDRFLLFPPGAALVLFLAGNQNFGFDPPGWLDAFMYLGYFWHYTDHVPLFEEYYKASRLPWVLPGYVAHQLFDVVTASVVLNWLTLSGGGIALYLLLRDALHDRVVAAVMGVAWVCVTPGHGVGGWNYQIAAAAVYYLGASWTTLRAADGPHHAWYAAAAGGLLACAIHTHLFFAVFIPLLLVLYGAGGSTWPSPRRVAVDASAAAAGGVGITALLVLVNGATGGQWLFFMPQVLYTRWLSEIPLNPWWFETSVWLPQARYLVLPVLGTLVGTIAVVRHARTSDRLAWVFVGQAWVAFVIFSYYQFVERQSVLDHDYMAFGIYCHAFPALATAVSRPEGLGVARAGSVVTALFSAAIIAGMLPLGVPLLHQRLQELSAAVGAGVPALLVMLAAGVAMLAPVVWLPRRVALPMFAVGFSVMNVWVAPSARPYGIGTPGIQKTMLELFRSLDRSTHELDPTLDRIEYWFTNEIVQTPQGPVDLAAVFDSYVSTRGWSGNLLATKSPGLPLPEIQADIIEGITCVGALSSPDSHERLVHDLAARFDTLERPARVIHSETLERPGLAIALSVLRLSRPAEPSGTATEAAKVCAG
jgi:hypothetical protein